MRREPAGAGENPLQRAVRPRIRCNQTDGTVGEPIRRPHLRHGVAQRPLHEDQELLDRLAISAGCSFASIEERNQRQVGGALGHRLERLAVETEAGHDPERSTGSGNSSTSTPRARKPSRCGDAFSRAMSSPAI